MLFVTDCLAQANGPAELSPWIEQVFSSGNTWTIVLEVSGSNLGYMTDCPDLAFFSFVLLRHFQAIIHYQLILRRCAVLITDNFVKQIAVRNTLRML